MLKLMKKYAVYKTDEIMGHYRVGKRNISASNDNSYKIQDSRNNQAVLWLAKKNINI